MEMQVLFKFKGGNQAREHRVSNAIEFGSRQIKIKMGCTDAGNLRHGIGLEGSDLEWRGLPDRQQ
jgi:hypothetical protein